MSIFCIFIDMLTGYVDRIDKTECGVNSPEKRKEFSL